MFSLYVSIAEFNIRICFGEIQYYDYSKRQLIHNIKRMYEGFFFSPTNTTSIDHTIFIVDETTYQVSGHTKNKKEYIHFFQTLDNTKTETWYHISSFHFAVIIKNILDKLLTLHQGFILHASAVASGERAFIFLGKSGAGKTTIMRLLYPEYTPIADDGIIVRKIQNTYYCFQLPVEKVRWFQRRSHSYHLASLFLLHQSKIDSITPIPTQAILPSLLEQLWAEKLLLKRQIQNLMNFMKGYRSYYVLAFQNKKTEVMKVFNLYQEDYTLSLGPLPHVDPHPL